MSDTYHDAAIAARYDAARDLPWATKMEWMDAIKAVLPQHQTVRRALDLGCGTGRFTAALAMAFQCAVVGLDPSAAMLEVARSRYPEASSGGCAIEWWGGAAESIPLPNEAVDLVFMSQAFHHLCEPRRALAEIHRVLVPSGHLTLRQSTRENNRDMAWLHCFPEAMALEEQRMLPRRQLQELVSGSSFRLISHHTRPQRFTGTSEEFCERIGRRGMSSLIAMTDAAFHSGLARLRAWLARQPDGFTIDEPIDLFVFQKQG
jgi:ubiquinone/menaquinone biosynthesis C-methylase UbiE